MLMLMLGASSCSKGVDVLIVTGTNDIYHSCDVMVPFLEETFSEWDAFNTDVIDMRDYTVEMFAPEFDRYDVVVLNINNAEWLETTKSSFVEYVRGGGGVVVIHEVNNAFPDWVEFNEIIGLGGWGGRSERAGSYLYYKDGELVREYVERGKTGSHGRIAPFKITVRDEEHPIMKGLPVEWMHYNDELYSNMRGPIGDLHPLASAYSDPATGGSGKEEILICTVNYGKGRVFHTMLGHTRPDYELALENRGSQVVLLRGTEWAATGKVTQTTPAKQPRKTTPVRSRLVPERRR